MTEPAAAVLSPTVDPARAAEAQAALTQFLRLVNILSGSLPGPGMGRDATRDVLTPRLQAVQAALATAGAEALLPSRCTAERDFFEGEATEATAPAAAAAPASTATVTTSSAPAVVPPATGTGPTTTTLMGAPATMADRSSLAEDALAYAQRQAMAIVIWGAGHAGDLAVWWAAFDAAARSLIEGVNARATALRDVVTGAGRNLRDFFAAWAIEAQRRFDTLVTALGIGAGVGAGAGILFLAFAIMYAIHRHT